MQKQIIDSFHTLWEPRKTVKFSFIGFPIGLTWMSLAWTARNWSKVMYGKVRPSSRYWYT